MVSFKQAPFSYLSRNHPWLDMRLIRSLGCKNCKEKRLKCDEGKPTCQQCEKKGVSCKGYQKDLKWRPQEDSFKNQTVSSRPRKSTPQNDGAHRKLADSARLQCLEAVATYSLKSCLICRYLNAVQRSPNLQYR